MMTGRRVPRVDMFIWLTFIIVLQFQSIDHTEAIDEVRVGILLKHRGLEARLNRTLEMLNADTSVLLGIRLVAIVEIIQTDNSYQTSTAVCRLLSQKVWAVIGPQSIQLTPIIQSVTSYFHIPMVLINWQPYSYYPENSTNQVRRRNLDSVTTDVPTHLNYTINLYPVADQLSQAFLDLIIYKNWKSFTLIYDSAEDFIQVKDIFETSFSDTNINIEKVTLPIERPPDSEHVVHSGDHLQEGQTNPDDSIKQFVHCRNDGSPTGSAHRKLLKELRKKGVENVVLSMPLDKVCDYLREASNGGYLTVYNDYIIANLDTHLLNLTYLQPVLSNISGYSILDPEGQAYEMTPSKNWLGKRPITLPKKLLSTEYAMMSDAIYLVAHSIDELINETDEGKSIRASYGDCNSDEIWEHGALLIDIMKNSIRHGGYTGDLRFDRFGQRVDFDLEFVLLRNSTFKRVGTWNPMNRLLDKGRQINDNFGERALINRTLKVTIHAKSPPYVMLKENYTELTGNDRYQGYCIDLLNRLAKMLKFNYVLHEVPDGQYGKIQNGSWTGMIAELLTWQADLAIVDLTINKERQSAVDFTHPFMTLGIAIMYQKPKMEDPQMYSFLMPFSKEVWFSMWSAYVATSLTLWLVSRLTPLEWKNPHPCVEDPDEHDLENEIHSIGASLWFTIGSLMQQGSDLAPRSPSVRALASVWYFFTLILISSYTANFAAFLTASRMQSPIESAEDLSKQTKIDYGCKEGGSTQTFFASSNHSTYRRMWNFMESRKHQGSFLANNEDGIKRVKKGNYAFLMESTSIEYQCQRDCELMQIGGLLDHKGYGIALRKRSPYRAPLSRAIVELNEKGELQDMKNRWWSSGQQPCEEQKESALATSELGIDKLGGVFVVLGLGVGIGMTAAILEFAWKSLKSVNRDSIRKMLWREFIRTLICAPSKRPAESNTHTTSSTTRQIGNSMNDSLNGESLANKSNYASAKLMQANLSNGISFEPVANNRGDIDLDSRYVPGDVAFGLYRDTPMMLEEDLGNIYNGRGSTIE